MPTAQQPPGESKTTSAQAAGRVLGAALGLLALPLIFGLNDPGDPAGQIAFLFILFVFAPTLSFLSYFHLKKKLPLSPKRRRYLATIAMQMILLVLGLRLALYLSPPWFHPRWGPPEAFLIGGSVAGAAMLGAYRKWKRPAGLENQTAATLLPVSAGEMLLWAPVSLLAGSAEEIAYRGVAVFLLSRWTGSVALAVILSAAAFGLAHMTQGGRAVLRLVFIAVTMQLVFFLTGTLYLPMLVHALYDLLLGVMFLWMNRKAAGAPQPAPQPSEG